MNIISQAKHTKVIMISAPYRYDKSDMIEYIDVYNKLRQMCVNNNVEFIDLRNYIEEEDYDTGKLHLKQVGKEKIMKVIAGMIQQQDF